MATDSTDQGEILIVDDTPANLSVLSGMLSKAGYTVRPAISGEVALRAIEASVPDIILLDIRMPDMDGFEVCQHLKADPRTADVPVIFISALSEIDDKLKAFDVGGVDYITKPFQAAEVRVRVNTHLTLARQRQQIEQLNQLKDQLIDTVTHNLKSPLGVVLGYSGDLRESIADEHQRAVTAIFTAGVRMEQLISGFLDLNKIESGLTLNPHRTVVQAIIKETAMGHAYDAENKGQNLTIEVPDADTTIITDSRHLTEALDNLISNAVKYTPSGGQITIALTTDDEHEAVQIDVRDTGLGIPAEYIPHVFDRFFRVPEFSHAQASGTGLGLAITAAVIERLGGTISVESEPDVGSTFSIRLPYRFG